MALLRGKTILVVEDEPLIALDLQAMLSSEGAQVIASPALDDAFRLAQRHEEISAAVLDVALGRNDCGPVCQLLEQRHVPFIFHTGYQAGGILDEWPHVPIVPKPASRDQPLKCLAGALNGAG